MDMILHNLAIGAAKDGLAPPARIKALLDVAREINLPTRPGAIMYKVPIVDMRPIPVGQLKEAVEWLENHLRVGPTLVYCNAGVGRSSSVVIAYLCTIWDFSFGDSVEFVARRHPNMSILPYLITTIDELKTMRGR